MRTPVLRGAGGGSISSGLGTEWRLQTARTFPSGLQAPGIAPWPVPVSLGSHLLLNSTCHGKSIAGPHLPRADVSQVDEIHRFPNHGPIDPPPLLLRLGFLYHAAAQFVPEFTHVPRWFQFHPAARGPTGLFLLRCLDRPLLTPCRRHSNPGSLSWRQESPRTLSWAVEAGVSDPEKAAGPGGGPLPRAWNPARLPHRGAARPAGVRSAPLGGVAARCSARREPRAAGKARAGAGARGPPSIFGTH